MSQGELIKRNVMRGEKSLTRYVENYAGLPIPPCGGYEGEKTVPSPWAGAIARLSLGGADARVGEEIRAFARYMTPTADELRARGSVVDRFKSLMAELEPATTLSLVGSTATNLCFALSDIDLVGSRSSSGGWGGSGGASLYTLESKIRRARFAVEITVISRAEVPVIKLIDAKTGLEINLVYAPGGIRSTRLVKEWKARYDAVDSGAGKGLFTIVVFFAKQLLKMRRLSETYTGGINSYLLVLMVVAWWELEYLPKVAAAVPDVLPAPQAVQDAMLAQAVVSFLKYYGSGLDYSKACIRLSPSPAIARKGYYLIRPWHLSLIDPNTNADIGKKAYAVKHVAASFSAAARELSEARYVQGRELLANVLGGNYRKFVAERAAVLRNAAI